MFILIQEVNIKVSKYIKRFLFFRDVLKEIVQVIAVKGSKIHRPMSVIDSHNNIGSSWVDKFNKSRFQFILFIDI